MEQLCFEGEPEECVWIRGELLSWDKAHYWFLVIDGQIWVMNEWAGRLSDERLIIVKAQAMELSRKWRDAR
jgi:hypothetical protein